MAQKRPVSAYVEMEEWGVQAGTSRKDNMAVGRVGDGVFSSGHHEPQPALRFDF